MCLAVPGQIVDIRDVGGIAMGTVDFDGIHKDVCLEYLPDAQLGDYTIVHVGFAISLIDEQSALETLEMFKDIGAFDSDLGESPQMDVRQEKGVGNQ